MIDVEQNCSFTGGFCKPVSEISPEIKEKKLVKENELDFVFYPMTELRDSVKYKFILDPCLDRSILSEIM